MNASHISPKRGYGYRRPVKTSRYPNGAESRYYRDRLADTALCTASGIGVATILFFLITMM